METCLGLLRMGWVIDASTKWVGNGGGLIYTKHRVTSLGDICNAPNELYVSMITKESVVARDDDVEQVMRKE